ncbi:MAG: PEGA domain-containing protein [Patescibacteria group bacterium]|jgi:hypothetical protein
MNLRYRRLIYLSFFAIFFIVTPIAILYTTGYRYNFKKHKIEKTGILYVDSKPKGALVYLNDQYVNKTPSRFTELLPDVYRVRVEKEGYYPWQKNLEVKSNLTTFSKNIILFKKSLPTNIIVGKINIFNISPSQDKLFYSTIDKNNEELKIYNLNNKTEFLIKSLDKKTYSQIELVGWAPDSNKALLKETIGDFNKFIITDVDNLKTKELFDITKLNFDKVIWDETNENYLYGLRKTALYQIDLVNNSAKNIMAGNISDFKASGKNIYYITKLGKESFLNKATLLEQKFTFDSKIKLPAFSSFTLQPSSQDYLVLLDPKNQNLFIITPNAFTTDEDINNDIVLQDKAKKIIWSKDYKTLLCYTDLEIWTFDLTTFQKNLITRYGKPIDQLLWYPDNKYAIYQTQNTIHAIEADYLEAKNDTQLAEMPQLGLIIVDEAGKNLFFVGQAGTVEGIYQLEIL